MLGARPDAIVSAAAYTGVDGAEAEPGLAHQVNAVGAGRVAAVAARLGVPVVHLSSDYVFDGRARRPYRESDPTGPLGVYGGSKLAGEAAVAAANPDHAILRTAWVYSPFGSNFVRTMLRLAGEQAEIGVVADQRGNPTSALDLADAIVAVAKNLIARPGDASLRGTFHVTGRGEASWADFAVAIFSARGGPRAVVRRIGTADYPTLAVRPAYSCLSGEKLARVHGVSLPAWRQSLRIVVARLVTAP